MADAVKTRRYDTTARRAQSAGTRRRILDAARAAMLERGYRGATIAAVAEAAGVHPDTVYELVGRKPALLRALVEQVISQAEGPLPPEEREYVQRIRAEPDPERKLAIYAEAVCRTHAQLAPLFAVIREAGPAEPEVAAMWREISERRAANMRLFVADVASARGLRPGLELEAAADAVWGLNSPELYLLMVGERGWPPEQFSTWLADTWRRILLP